MHDIFVLAEHREGELREVTLEMLTLAGQIAEQSGGKITAVLLGSGVDEYASKCASFADRVLVVDDPTYENYNSAAYQQALVELIKAEKPHLVLIGNTGQGVDLAPSLAVELDVPYTSDVVSVTLEGDKPVAGRQYYGGKIDGRIEFKDADLYILAIREASTPAGEGGKSGEIQKIDNPVTTEVTVRKFLEYVEAAIGDVDGAIALARSLPEPHQRINTLVAIAEAEIEEGDPARARAVLVALVEEADSRADDEDRDGTLADAVYKLVAADDPVRALSAARAIRADGKRIKLVAFVTGALARAGDAAGAAKALSGMSEVAGAIADVGARVDALTALAGAAIEVRDTGAAARMILAALEAASAIADDEDRTWPLIDIAELYARAGDAGRAHDAAGRVPDPYWRANAYFAVAGKQAEIGDAAGVAETLTVALRAAQEIPDDHLRNQAVMRASFEHIEAGDLEGAIEAARLVEDDGERAGILRYVAEKLGETGDVAGAKEILVEARGAVRAGAEAFFTGAQTYVSGNIQGLIAETYAQLGDTREALRTARDIADDGERAKTLRAIARLRAEAGDAEGAKATLFEALRTTAAIVEDDDRARALAAAAVQLAGLGQ